MSQKSLLHLFNTFYEPLKLITASRSCKEQHRRNIGKLSRLLRRPAELPDLTDDNLARLMSGIMAAGRSPATANKVMSQLRAQWEFYARRGLRRDYPTIGKLPEYKRTPTAWTRPQLVKLFQALRETQGRIHAVLASTWWICLHAVLWDTGVRIGALLLSEWPDIDWERGEITIQAERQKQRADQRFKLHADTLAVLSLIRHETGPLFPWKQGRTTLWDHYKAILQRAGLPHGRRDKFHRMRRSVASWFEACGGNATDLLGHSSRKVTEAYLDPTITGKLQAADVLFRPWAV